MLAVSIELHGNIVAVRIGEFVAGLHRAANAEVLAKVDVRRADVAQDFGRVVRGAIVDDQVVVGQLLELRGYACDRGRFVVGGNHDEHVGVFGTRARLHCEVRDVVYGKAHEARGSFRGGVFVSVSKACRCRQCGCGSEFEHRV